MNRPVAFFMASGEEEYITVIIKIVTWKKYSNREVF